MCKRVHNDGRRYLRNNRRGLKQTASVTFDPGCRSMHIQCMSNVRERLAKHRAHPAPEELLEKVWPPMLAVLAQPPLKEDDYWLEVKYDGYRGIAALSAGRLAFQSRNKLDLSPRFPDAARAIAQLRMAEAVIDGEVVAFDAKGATRFQQLMTPGVEHHYMAFDLLWLDGEDVRGRPIEERRDLLESVLARIPRPIHLSERLNESLEGALAEAKRRGLERLAEDQGIPSTGSGDRRIHADLHRKQRNRSSAGRRSRRQSVPLCGQGGHRVYPSDATATEG